ncbi:MAG: MucB/RseB C-terminal domain-containing protein [Burkholderiales bacterium]|nr:MucB/RseB C-terminal domain-containing protein [Burkholderiales bacterium]
MKALLAALLLGLGAIPLASAADATSPAEGMRLLRQMANAARQLNYSGTFVYRHGAQIETSRIWHLTDASGDYERLETLDGPRREVVRSNEEVTCFYPGSKTAKVEQWNSSRRFPGVVSEQLAAIVASYTVRKGAIDRVAGYDCQIATLEPRDTLRYGHVFCAELKSGLPLRARTVNERNETVELFAFTQVDIGGEIPREKLRPSYDPLAPGWKLERSALSQNAESDMRWTVLNRPAGFRKVLELKRTIQGKSAAQIVFSDGLAAVSVFIEPAVVGTRAAQELTHQGAISIFIRPQADYVVTALGEAPAATIMQFGNSVMLRSKPGSR